MGAQGPRASLERALKLGYGLSILGTVPIMVLPFFTTARPLLTGADGQLTVRQQQAVTLCVMVLALLLALAVPNVELIFAFTGATASMVLAYILPAAMHLRATWLQDAKQATKPVGCCAVLNCDECDRPHGNRCDTR